MTGHSQGYDKVRRKRIKQKFCYETKVILFKKNYNVMDEHNYCRYIEKKKVQRSIKENSLIGPTEIKLIKHNENDSLPDWLKVNKNESDDEDDNEVKSLAQLLKREHENDLTDEVGTYLMFYSINF